MTALVSMPCLSSLAVLMSTARSRHGSGTECRFTQGNSSAPNERRDDSLRAWLWRVVAAVLLDLDQ
jgi:hypothetical protein